MAVKRRDFCRLAGLTVIGVTGAASSSPRAAERQRSSGVLLGEPLVGERWAMVVDLQACRKQWASMAGAFRHRWPAYASDIRVKAPFWSFSRRPPAPAVADEAGAG